MKIAKMLVLMLVSILAISFVNAQNLEVEYVKANGEYMDLTPVGDLTSNLKVQRGEDLDLIIRVKALTDVNNVQVGADIYGYKYSHREQELVSAMSRVFDLKQDDYTFVKLSLKIPVDMDQKYTRLRIRVGDENGETYEVSYQLHVTGVAEEDAVIVSDYSISPSDMIAAGRALSAKVKVKNIGNYDLDDVKVTVSIPKLNVRYSAYLDELRADRSEELENFILRIPECTEPGLYELEILVEFDKYESTKETTLINVLEGDACVVDTVSKEKTVIVAPEAQETNAGSEVGFPIMITNQGTNAKTYMLTVSGVNTWGESRVSPSAVTVVKAGETKTVYIHTTPNSDAEGEKVFMATVQTDESTETIPLTVNVAAKEGTSLNKGLQVALIVLVIVLIIIGLIIGFSKLKGSNDEETQTYY